jgi:hypothetical protein
MHSRQADLGRVETALTEPRHRTPIGRRVDPLTRGAHPATIKPPPPPFYRVKTLYIAIYKVIYSYI